MFPIVKRFKLDIMKQIFTLLIVMLIGFSLQAQVERKVIAEHFTNTKCAICANKNPAFNQLLEGYPQVLRISFHPSSPYSTCIFSQHNPEENDARTNFYGIYGGTPRVVLHGNVIPIQTPLLRADQIDAELGMTSDYSISIEHNAGSGDEVNVSVTVTRVSGSGSEEHTLYAFLAEKEVDYNAPNGETMHHGVFRQDLIEESVMISASGNSLTFEENYTPDGEWEAGEMVVVVILQADDKSILQAEESDFVNGGSAGIGDSNYEMEEKLFYPNPATDFIQLLDTDKERFVTAEIYDLVGSKVIETAVDRPIDIRSFPEGLYFVILTDRNNQRYTTKILKSGR